MKLGQLAEAIGAQLRGDPDYEVKRVASLEQAGPGQLSFLASSKYRRLLGQSRAGALILAPRDADAFAGNVLVSANPYAAYARAAQLLHPAPVPAPGVHHTAQLERDARVHPSVRIDAHAVVGRDTILEEGVWLGPGAVVGDNCRIGPHTRIYANAVLYAGTRVGARCIIHAGAVIGADGFGFASDQGRYEKIPQIGAVCLGDDVEVGANATIDRGALGDTVIEDGVKLDNLVQVGHNVRIGAHTVIAGQTGIAGSTRIGRNCVIGGQVGIAGHIELVDGVVLSGKSMVTSSISEPGVYSSGMPIEPNSAWRRSVVRLHRLEQLYRRVDVLEAAVRSGAGREAGPSFERTSNNKETES